MELDKLVGIAAGLEADLRREHDRVHRRVVLQQAGPQGVPMPAPSHNHHNAQTIYNQDVQQRHEIRKVAGRLRRFAWHMQACARLADEIAQMLDVGADQ